MNEFRGNPAVKRFMAHVGSGFLLACPCGFQSNGWVPDVWETWFPKVKRHYSVLMDYLSTEHQLAPAYQMGKGCPALPFMASTVNLGPKTVTAPHYDGQNLATGLCGIMPFGPFDSSRSGQLCLHEPRVILEMAPGQVALIPSAVIQHSNLPLLGGDKRYSITTYTSGHLFAWMENQGPVRDLSPAAKELYVSKGQERWLKGWGRFPQGLRKHALE